VLRELDEIASGKPRGERDTDIVNASDIMVVVLPYSQPSVWKLLREAALAGRKVIYIRAEPQPNPVTEKRVPAQLSFPADPAPPAEKITWAERQGKADRAEGITCPDYRAFCAKFGIPGSALAQQMWSAYTRPMPRGKQQADNRPPSSVQQVIQPQRPGAAGSASSPGAPARPNKPSAAPSNVKPTRLDQHGIPVEWYEMAVRTLGASADVQDDGSSVRLVLKSGGKVIAEVPAPRGREAAASSATAFNRETAKRKLNPPEALADAWR
jgi:hypothetical protein